MDIYSVVQYTISFTVCIHPSFLAALYSCLGVSILNFLRINYYLHGIINSKDWWQSTSIDLTQIVTNSVTNDNLALHACFSLSFNHSMTISLLFWLNYKRSHNFLSLSFLKLITIRISVYLAYILECHYNKI